MACSAKRLRADCCCDAPSTSISRSSAASRHPGTSSLSGAARFSGESSAHNVPDRRNPESRIPTCSAQCSQRMAGFKHGRPHCRANRAFCSDGHGGYRFHGSLSAHQERLDCLRSSRANHHAAGLLMSSWSRAPNKRSKPPGGDRFRGKRRVVRWRARTIVQLHRARRASHPQLDRDPLGRTRIREEAPSP